METETKKEVGEFMERLRSRRPQLERCELKSLGVVYMRKPTGEDQAKIAGLRTELSAQKLVRLPQSVFAAVMGSVLLMQEDGTPYFEDVHKGFSELNAIDGDDLLELYNEIMRVIGLDPKAVENAEKKSLSGQTSESGTN